MSISCNQLMARINLALYPKGARRGEAPSRLVENCILPFYMVELERGRVERIRVDLEKLAREEGLMTPDEELVWGW